MLQTATETKVDEFLAKVRATAQAIGRLDSSIEVDLVEDRYRHRLTVGQTIFCCVDSIDVRGAIWRLAGRRAVGSWIWKLGTLPILQAPGEIRLARDCLKTSVQPQRPTPLRRTIV